MKMDKTVTCSTHPTSLASLSRPCWPWHAAVLITTKVLLDRVQQHLESLVAALAQQLHGPVQIGRIFAFVFHPLSGDRVAESQALGVQPLASQPQCGPQLGIGAIGLVAYAW